MGDDSVHHVTIRLAREYAFVAEFNDVPGARSVMFDEPPPVGTGQAPTATDMLGAAVGNCLCASLAFCLRKARVELRGLTARVTTRVTRNEKGHHRIASIDVQLTPALGSGTPIDRCAALFEDFCTVTASVRHGIPVSVSLAPSPASIES